VVIVAGAMLLISSGSRRLLAVFAVPLYFFALDNVHSAYGSPPLMVTDVPFALLPFAAALAALAARRRPGRRAPADSHGA
jgi:hypothetical protein